jgi:hypothetical protein
MPSHPTGPLTAFRIADDRFPLLDGGGAFKIGGRWNSKGRYVVYAGIGFATAMLEKLAHTRIGKIPVGNTSPKSSFPARSQSKKSAQVMFPGGPTLTMRQAAPTAMRGTTAGVLQS